MSHTLVIQGNTISTVMKPFGEAKQNHESLSLKCTLSCSKMVSNCGIKNLLVYFFTLYFKYCKNIIRRNLLGRTSLKIK